MRSPIRTVFREMQYNAGLPIEFLRGDDFWCPSLHFNWKWRGQWYWLCVFFDPSVFMPSTYKGGAK